MALPLRSTKSKFLPLTGVELSLADIRRIANRLLDIVHARGREIVSGLIQPSDKTAEQWDAEKQTLLADAFGIIVTVAGANGERLHGNVPEVFDSPNMPARIESIYLSNIVPFERRIGVQPDERFTLLFDFSKPPLLDSQNFVSSRTPNNSHIDAIGNTDTWVGSIIEAVTSVTSQRKISRLGLHKGFSYDVGLFALWLPINIYICYRMSPLLSDVIGRASPLLGTISYAYAFFALAFLFRVLYGYTKWAFPTVELEENKKRTAGHRNFWYVLALGLLATAVWEVGKAFFSAAPIGSLPTP